MPKRPAPTALAIGSTIRGARAAARLTQAQLGARIGYSGSAVSRIESGELHPDQDTIALIGQLLQLAPEQLGLTAPSRGLPSRPSPMPAAPVAATVASVPDHQEDAVRRRNLLAGAVGLGAALALPGATAAAGAPASDPAAPVERALFNPQSVPAWTAARVATALSSARADFRAARYAALGSALPALIAGAEAARDDTQGHAREHAHSAVARTYVLATELAFKEHADFAWVTADRALAAARTGGDPVVIGEAARVLAITMRRAGRPQAAVDFLARTAATMTGPGAERQVRATLLLTAAYTAATGSRRSTALSLMSEAEDAVAAPAPAVGGLFTVEASRAQCDVYWIGVHNALGTPDEGVPYAARIAPQALPSAERRARYATDAARMWHALGDQRRTFGALRAVEAAAPEEARRPALQALTAGLLYGPGTMPGLRDFARRTGAVTIA